MKKVFVILCSLIMLGFVPVKAQKVWTLEECIMYALENNLQIKRQELNVQFSKTTHSQSYFNTLPNVNGQINYGRNDGNTIDNSLEIPRYVNQKYWDGTYGLQSSVTLFGGFQIINNIIKTKYDFLKSQTDLDKSKNDISLQLALAYLQILFSKELVDVAKSKLDVTTLQTERTQKMLQVGNVSQGEFLQIKAQESNDKTSLINAQNNLDIAYLDLTQLLDLDSVSGFDIVIPGNIEVELLGPLSSVQEIFTIAIETMPQIKSAQYALKSSEKELSMAWGQLSPSVTMSGSLSSRYSQTAINPTTDPPSTDYPFKDQMNDYYYKNLNFGVSIPIFNKFQVKNSISNSKLQVMDYKYQLDLAKMALYKEVQQAHADASAAREKYNSSVEAVNYNEEAFKYTSQKMDVGLVNSVDYNIAQNNLISAQSSMLQAKYEYIFKLKILDLYMGKAITL
jgi:outer membrane protein